MPGATLEVSTDDRALTRVLRELGLRMKNAKPAFDDIGEYLLRSVEERFKKERDPQGQPWAPLAESTLESKQRRGKVLKILTEDSHLRRIVRRATRDQLEVGSDRVYGRIQQFGGHAGRGRSTHIVPRPYLGLSREDEAEMTEIFAEHLEQAMGRTK